MPSKWGGGRVKALRSYWAPRLPQPCPRCGEAIQPSDQWDLGHRTALAERTGDHAIRPEHARCNRSAGGRLGNQHKRTGTLSRAW